jgi:hypothetical protein
VLQVHSLAVGYQEDHHGELPSAEWVEERPRAEGASEGASLVMVRQEIRDADGEAIPIDGSPDFYRKPAIVRDAATCIALEIKRVRGIRIKLRRPDGHEVNPRDLLNFASEWDWPAEWQSIADAS